MENAEIVNPGARPFGRRGVWPIALGAILTAVLLLIAMWDWNWVRPLLEARASAQIGRKVTIGHFDLRLSGTPTAILDDVEVANPDGFADTPYFARVDRLSVTADALAYLRSGHVVLPRIEVQRPDANLVRLADGRTNYVLDLAGSSDGAAAQIGQLTISDGQAHVLDPKYKADFRITVASRQEPPDNRDQIVVGADGTYAGQKITGQAVGGALLSLRDPSNPYPIDAHIESGPTRLDLSGSVQDPVHFKGSNLTLHVAGPDMALLGPLSGFSLPRTPNFDISGQLDYADRKIRLSDLRGRVGSSDLSGIVTMDPAGARPIIEVEAVSRRVDLADFGGLIGSEPGRLSTPGQSEEQKREVARAEASPQLLPTRMLSVPDVKAADLHLRYKGDLIIGRGVPFDSVSAVVDIDDGTIRVHPATLGVGRGTIGGEVTLVPAGEDQFHLTSDIRFDHVDVGRLLDATGAVKGTGLLGGRAELDSTGNSVASLARRGTGSVRLMMAGGNLSALLVDLSGLQFGNALLSALGLPNRTALDCFVADLALQNGRLDTRTLLVIISDADITVSGSLDLAREALDYRLRTESRHFSVGSLPIDIGIGGTLKNPRIMPKVRELAARSGAAIGLGVLLTPLGAVLPTVQFGSGDKNANACAAVIRANGKRPTPASAATPPAARKTAPEGP